MNEINNQNELIVISDLSKINELSSSSYNYEKLTNQIKDDVKSIFRNFLNIGCNLVNVKKDNIYLIADYNSIYEYGLNEFDLGKTTIKNLINIAERFCELNDNVTYSPKLKEEFKDFNYSQLVELLSVDEDKIKNYLPTMSVREIKANKNKEKLLDYYNSNFDLSNENSFGSQLLKYVLDNYQTKFDLSYEFKKEEQYYNRQIIGIKTNKSFIFEIRFDFNNYDHTLKYSLYGNYHYLFNTYSSIEFKTFDDFKTLVDRAFNIHQIELDKKNNFITNIKVQNEDDDCSEDEDYNEDNEYEEDTIEEVNINPFEPVSFPQLISNCDFVLNPFITYIYQFHYHLWQDYKFFINLNDEVFVIISDTEKLKFSNAIDLNTIIEFYKNDLLIQKYTFYDLIFSSINNILNGQTFDQQKKEEKSILIINDEYVCPSCKFHLEARLQNFCGKCGQPLTPPVDDGICIEDV